MRVLSVLFAAWLLSACVWSAAEPKVTVTSVVERESIGITVYNPAVSLVQERRTLSLNKGLNEFRVTWAGVTVQRDSVRLEPVDGDNVMVRDVVLPQDDPNTVIWHLDAKRPGPQPVSITYYAGGFSWGADYVMTVDGDEKQLWLKTWANVTNASGESYADAMIRLVMGDVRVISVGGAARPTTAAGAQLGANTAMDSLASVEWLNTLIVRGESFAEYTFFTLERPETLDSGDTKRIALAASTAIPVRKVYTYDPNAFGDSVAMQYWFDNKKEYELGAMPPGLLRAYRKEHDGRLSLLGEDQLPYVPVDETAKIYLGNARNVIVETAQTDYQQSEEQWSPDKSRLVSYVEERAYRVTLTNRKAQEIELIVRQYIPDDAKLMDSDPAADQPRLGELEWKLELDSGQKQELTYRYSRKIYK
jgi:hypothetical protein